MQVFNARHFLRHIGMPTLQEFTTAHVLGPRLSIDWSRPAATLPAVVADAVDGIALALRDPALAASARRALEQDWWLWHDDLRRAHLMANGLAIQEFRHAGADDALAAAAFAVRDEREIALWMLAHREPTFRAAELHLAFQARANGKYWQQHRILPHLEPTRDRAQLETFGREVAKVYQKVGAGAGVHVEISDRAADDSVQLTLYVEGPVTALAQFAQNSFTRLTTRIALETAIVYRPACGTVETIVKGGARNHAAVLQLFGQHVVGQELAPQAIAKRRFRLNALRDGVLEPGADWSRHGVEKVRLRRVLCCPLGQTGVGIQVVASPAKEQDDALQAALRTLQVAHAFAAEYNLEGATLIVYLLPAGAGQGRHFSFDVSASGSSTIRNLSAPNQLIATAVLRALHVMDAA